MGRAVRSRLSRRACLHVPPVARRELAGRHRGPVDLARAPLSAPGNLVRAVPAEYARAQSPLGNRDAAWGGVPRIGAAVSRARSATASLSGRVPVLTMDRL